MPRPRLSTAIKKFKAAGQRLGPSSTPTPTATPTRPRASTSSQSPTPARATRTPTATPSRPPSRASNLGRLSKAFAPKFVLPADLRAKHTRQAITATAAAAQSIASAKGVSFEEAGAILRTVGVQIKKAQKMRTQILRADPSLSQGQQIKILRGGGGLARLSGSSRFVSREIAGFVVLGGTPNTRRR